MMLQHLCLILNDLIEGTIADHARPVQNSGIPQLQVPLPNPSFGEIPARLPSVAQGAR